MPVGRGEVWGEPGVLPDGAPVARRDAEVAAFAARGGGAERCIGLLAGDLARTVGATGDDGRLRGPAAHRLPIDVGTAILDDGRSYPFVAHVIARRSWWSGRVVAVCNAQYRGRWDVAPRSHPNDGLLDVVDADLSLGDRWKAWRRLPSGTHVPHPAITQRRRAVWETTFDRSTRIWVDGTAVGASRSLRCELTPDACIVVV